jgi:hemolysin-activating ACP:hemolysin acyltransferase
MTVQTPLTAGSTDTPKLTKMNPDAFARHLGLASWLMSMSKEHQYLPMSVLEKRVLPAILLQQFRLVQKDGTPVAFLTWATVSDELREKAESTDFALELTEWRSGDNFVIIDCVSPFGSADKLKSDFLSRMNAAGKQH